ncbi:MAG TPA: heparinase II/III family protein [Lacunisphaera sp.]|nr:heparinase II/III family protein [Lacunisphaera sp.]
MPSCRFVFLLLGLPLLSGAVSIARAEAAPWKPGDLVRHEPAAARAAAEGPRWRERLPAERPRLFYRQDELPGLRARYVNATGQARKWFAEGDKAVREILAAPVAAYRTPEEMVTPTRTLYDARAELWQREVGNNLVMLSLALLLRDDPTVRAKLHETVLAACAYPQWGISWNGVANRDLAAAHVSRGIALAYDLHPGLWSADEKARIRQVITERVAVLHDSLYHGGPLYSNHNHVAASAVGLCGVAFLGEIPAAEEWCAAALLSFDNAFHFLPPDGGSEEGVPYGTYSLTAIMEFIEGTKHVLGSDVYYHQPHLRNYIAYRVHASTPGFAGVFPWGDAPERDYYGPHHILYRLASEYRLGEGNHLASQLPFSPRYETHSGWDMVGWTALWFDPSLSPRPPVELDRFSPNVNVVSSRSGWGGEDYQLALKSGFTNRYHSHLDAGAIAWNSGGEWLLTTPGYGHGSGEKDYWDREGGKRWEYFANATEAETTLLVNGRNQRWDPAARGRIDEFAATAGWCWTGVDLSAAYADTRRVRRDVLHGRGEYALVFDEVLADAPVTVEWLAQTPPQAKATTTGLLVPGRAGGLELRAVSPAGLPFAPRAPTKARVDVDSTRLATHALRSEGRAVQFTVALLPEADGATIVDRIEETPADGARAVVVHGKGWREEVFLAPPGEAREWKGDGLAAAARLVVARSGAQGVERLLLVGARHVSLPGVSMTFLRATAAEFHRTPGGSWLADFAAPAPRTP